VSDEQLDELGPVDYVVLEWAGQKPDASEVQPLLLDLVDRGIIRILDIAFVAKDQDGSVTGLELGDSSRSARPSPSSRAPRRASWASRTSRRQPPRSNRAPRPP
jgi:hypothetical protein